VKFSGDIFETNWRQPSAIALMVANLIPLFGIFAFHWAIFPLMFLFWFENLIIGVFNVLRMMVAVPFATDVLPYIPFFFLHYGMFLAGHCMVIFAIFGGGTAQYPILNDPFLYFSWHGAASFLGQIIHENHLELPVIGLAISRGTSFVMDYLRAGEYRHVTAKQLFWQPYGRIVILHLALIGGGTLMQAWHSPVVGLILLIILKIVLDLAGYLWERKRAAAPTA
jgi:Family of unknown function (DUF6498)